VSSIIVFVGRKGSGRFDNFCSIPWRWTLAPRTAGSDPGTAAVDSGYIDVYLDFNGKRSINNLTGSDSAHGLRASSPREPATPVRSAEQLESLIAFYRFWG
jgi:hypothetical protein